MNRYLTLALTVPLIAACSADAPAPAAPDGASFRVTAGPGAELIPGQYIVVLRDNDPEVSDARGRRGNAMREMAERLASRRRGRVRDVYANALRGFSANMSEADARALASDPQVAFVEQDQVMRADVTTQSPATWGLDRIDERAPIAGADFSYTNNGQGVTAYIIDTGILLGHTEFAGRVTTGFDAVTANGNANDCNGHGTHVAGTVGGTTYGVAKKVSLIAVRVLSCTGSGSNAGVIAGVDWVRGHHAPGVPAVANMSLGGGASTALDNAVAAAIADGVTFAVAAGNSNRDACNYSPARTAAAITVGATTSTDARASYSNFGSCLDIFAPGSAITSAWIRSTTDVNTISGTSMASPHVAGVAALYLQGNTTASPATVRNALVANGTTGLVTSAGRRSPNILLHSNY